MDRKLKSIYKGTSFPPTIGYTPIHVSTGLVLFLGVLFPTLVLGQFTTECAALVQYAQLYTDCETFGNCSGTRCSLSQQLTGSNATFLIEEKCADPVMVDLSVDGPSPLGGYRGRFSVGGDGLHTNEPHSIRVDYGRNASHLHFHVCMSVCMPYPVCTPASTVDTKINESCDLEAWTCN